MYFKSHDYGWLCPICEIGIASWVSHCPECRKRLHSNPQNIVTRQSKTTNVAIGWPMSAGTACDYED